MRKDDIRALLVDYREARSRTIDEQNQIIGKFYSLLNRQFKKVNGWSSAVEALERVLLASSRFDISSESVLVALQQVCRDCDTDFSETEDLLLIERINHARYFVPMDVYIDTQDGIV